MAAAKARLNVSVNRAEIPSAAAPSLAMFNKAPMRTRNVVAPEMPPASRAVTRMATTPAARGTMVTTPAETLARAIVASADATV